MNPTGNGSPSEREKWEAEKEFRHREITVKEREQSNREAELNLKSKEHASSTWRSPVVVAILSAAAVAVGNAVVSGINGSEQRSLEKQRSEQARILEMVKTGNPDKAAENLMFLLDAGLIADSSIRDNLRQFLATREPGSGPTLPSESGNKINEGITGIDDAVPTKNLPEGSLKQMAQAVGQLICYDGDGAIRAKASAFLVGPNLLLTAGYAINESTDAAQLLMIDKKGNQMFYKIILPALEREQGTLTDASYALLRVEGNPGATWGYLPLASSPPIVGQSLSLIMFRSSNERLVISGAPECKILSVKDFTFTHLCDTGPGSGGSVLLSSDGSKVVGIHLGHSPDKVERDKVGSFATRADVIKKISKTL